MLMLPIEEVFYDETLEKGREEDLEKGREEGVLIQSREAVLQVLITRFNSIPASLAASVKNFQQRVLDHSSANGCEIWFLAGV